MIYLDNIITYKEKSNQISFKKFKIDDIVLNVNTKITIKNNNNLLKSTNSSLYCDIFDNKITYNNMRVKIMTMKQELLYLQNIFLKDYFLNYYQTNFDIEIINMRKIITKKKLILKEKCTNITNIIKLKLEIINIIQICIDLYFKKIKYLNKIYYLQD